MPDLDPTEPCAPASPLDAAMPPMGTPVAGTTLWPVASKSPHVWNPRANAGMRDPLAQGCCQWAKEHPVHNIGVGQ